MAAAPPQSPRRASRGARRSLRGSKTASELKKENNVARSLLLKQRPGILPDLDNATPRFLLRKIIQTQPEVSPLVLQISKHEETEESELEPSSKRASSTVEMQVPDFAPENTSVIKFRTTKKKKKLSISEFERAADKRLAQNQTRSALDSTSLAGSSRMSFGSLVQPDTVEKRGLVRRPKKRKAIDVEAFEAGVEQNMLQRKAQNYLVDSSTASMIRRTMLTNDTEIVMSNTELFVQAGEENQHRPPAVEPQLQDSKISPQSSKTIDAVPEEAELVDLESNVAVDGGRNQRYSEKNLILDYDDVGRTTPVSPKTPVSQRGRHQGHSHRSDLVETFSVPEERVSGKKSGTESLKKTAKRADMLEDWAVTGEIVTTDEVITDDEAEMDERESGDISMKTPAFIRAAAYKPLTLPSTPPPAESDVPKITPQQPLRAKPVPKRSGVSQRKKREPELPSSLIKKIFRHYAKMPVSRDTYSIIQKCCTQFFKRLCDDLEAYSRHAGRNTVEMADFEVLMRRQGLVTDKMPLHVLIERHLPLEYRKLLIPVAASRVGASSATINKES